MSDSYKGRKSPAKKFLSCAVVMLVIVVAVVVGYYEINFETVEIVPVSISEEKLLAEMTDIALTDADYALGERILANPEVVNAMENGESVELSNETTAALFADDLPENASSENMTVYQNAVYCDYLKGEDQRVTLTFFKDNEYGPYKTIAVYHGNGRNGTVVYENQAGEMTKMKTRHRWFAYLRDRMWEET